MAKKTSKHPRYYAFISYKHQSAENPWAKNDESWAQTIYKQLINWDIPVSIDKSHLINENDKQIKPIFRDKEEIYGGKNTSQILNENLLNARSLIVICSEKMIKDQNEKRQEESQENKNKPPQEQNIKAYIYHEIDFFLNHNPQASIIPIWIDTTPFDKNNPNHLPPQLIGRDIKTIEVNDYRSRKTYKKETVAETAASIFQSNKTLFWDYYQQKRREFIWKWSCIIAIALAIIGAIGFNLWKSKQISEAYRMTANATEALTSGNRYQAIKLAADAYSTYSSTEGISSLMWKCLDEASPYMTLNSTVEVNEAQGIYAYIENNRYIKICDLKDCKLLENIDAGYVKNITLSKDCNLIACDTGNSIRVYDRQAQTFIHEFHIDVNNYKILEFNNKANYLFVSNPYNQQYFATKIYSLNRENTQSYPFYDYTNIDHQTWQEATGSFMGTDSLFAIFGKMYTINSQGEPADPNEKGQWACRVYNLNKKDPLKSSWPIFCNEISIPKNATNVAVSPQLPVIIITTPSEIWVYKQIYGNNFQKFVLKYTVITGSDTTSEEYILKHPEIFHINVTNIQFSQDGQWALLITENNIRYTLPLHSGTYPRLRVYNGLGIHQNKIVQHNNGYPLGISNKGDILLYLPWVNSGKNIAIEPSPTFINDFILYKPFTGTNLEYEIYHSDSLTIITERPRPGEQEREKGRSTETRSYIYKKNHSIALEKRFNQNKDTTLVCYSPALNYAVLETKQRQYLLWDNLQNKIKYNLSNFISPQEYISDTQPNFFGATEQIIGLRYYCKQPNSEKETFSNSYILLDIEKGEIIVDKTSEHSLFENIQLNEQLLYYKKNGSTYIYDLKSHKIIKQLRGYYRLPYHTYTRPSSLVLLQRTIGNRIEEKVLYDINQNQIRYLPDSLVNKITFISPNGQYFIQEWYGNYKNNQTGYQLLIRQSNTYNIVARFPLTLHYANNPNDIPMFFTPDNRYFIYMKSIDRDIVIYDLQRMQEICILPYFIEWHKQQSWQNPYGLERETYASISVTNQYLAICSNNLKLIKLMTGETVAEFDLPLRKNTPLKFTPNGKYLIADCYLIDVEQKKILCQNLKPSPFYITNQHIVYPDSYVTIDNKEQLYQKLLKELYP